MSDPMTDYLAKRICALRGLPDDQWRQCVADARLATEILNGPGKIWHAFQIHGGMETRVASDLRRQGYIEFIAFTFHREKAGHDVVPWPTLRFPGYIFVQIDYGRKQDFHPVMETLGVIDVLSIGNLDGAGIPQPSAVPNQVIEIFRWDMIEDYDEAVRRVRRKECGFIKGDRVLVHRSGNPWEGQEFTVEEARPGRVMVKLPNGWPLPFLESDIVAANTLARAVHRRSELARA
jgi:transcription antitermination factor NusG